MTFRNVLLTAHILFAIVVIGWLVMQSMLVPGAIRKGQAGFVRFAADAAKKIGPTSTIVFFLGIWLVLRDKHDGIEFSDGWVSAAMVMFIVTAVIGAVFIGKAEHVAAEKLEAGQDAAAEASRIAILGGVSTLLLIAIVYLMVAKPGGY
jgi:uncharacterized membrane protein